MEAELAAALLKNLALQFLKPTTRVVTGLPSALDAFLVPLRADRGHQPPAVSNGGGQRTEGFVKKCGERNRGRGAILAFVGRMNPQISSQMNRLESF